MDQHRAYHAKATWRTTQANDAQHARSRDTWCYVIANYGSMQPTSLREGRVRIGISERTKHEVLSAAPVGRTHTFDGRPRMDALGLREAWTAERNGFTAVRNTYSDPDRSIADRCMCTMERD
jgi:hypothetical protein